MAEVKKYIIEEADLINIADSVRAKRGTTAKMDVKTIPQEILNIETLIPEGYLKPEGTQSITKNGIYDIGEYANVNVNVPIPEGYLDPEGTQEITANGGYNVELLEWVDVNVPIPDGYIIPAGKINISDMNEVDVTDYATAQIVDSNLIAENIAENVEVLGITGTFKGRIDTSDATATSDDMLLGKIAYVNDNKVVGNIETWDGTFEGDAERYQPLNDFLRGIKIEITADDMANVEAIGKYQFYYSPITSIEIPTTTTPPLCSSIGEYAFANSQLTSIDIPDHVLNVYQGAFSGCSQLTSVKLSNNITSIPNNTFYACSNLTSVTIGDSVTSIGGRAFYACKALTKITLPETLTGIGTDAFDGCHNLVIDKIPDSVTAIGDAAFRSCGSVLFRTVPNGVTRIGDYTFWGCGFTSFMVPSSTTFIGTYAFMNNKFEEFICLAETPPTLSGNAFLNCPADFIIKVPTASVEAYKSATNWSVRADYIVAYEEEV